MRQKGITQILALIVVLLIAFVLVFTANPSLKNKIFDYFKNVSQGVVSSPTPTSTPTVTPTPTPRPTPVKTPPPAIPKPSATAPMVVSDKLPASGYSSFYVNTDTGTFKIAVGAANVATTKVVVDTASDSDCTNNCPVMSLSSYVQRRNAYAGINGTYFCPASYPSCVGMTNSFNFLVMNINKYYFNSSMNVYSNNSGAIFAQSYVRFVNSISEWGRDTSPDGVISNYPLLVFNGNVNFSGSSDSKLTIKTTRSFVANKGTTIYIGDIFGASAVDSAHVLHTLGVDNALNLDDAGSAAFWWGGYKVGPGRDLPNAILFIQR